MNSPILWTGVTLTALAVTADSLGAEPSYRSHPPMRPLPAATSRPMDKGPAYFVDPVKGDDRNEGSKEKPWKTLNHALKQHQGGPLKPGDTLYLRGGTYYEAVSVASSSTTRPTPGSRSPAAPTGSFARPNPMPPAAASAISATRWFLCFAT
jgi:hypothetical protein